MLFINLQRVAKKLNKFLSPAKLYPKISILQTCCSKLEEPRRPWCWNGFFVLFSFYFVAFNSLFCFCTYFEISIISFAENLCFFFFFHFFEFSCWLSSTIRRLSGFHWSCEFMISVSDFDWYTYTNCCQTFILCSLKAN